MAGCGLGRAAIFQALRRLVYTIRILNHKYGSVALELIYQYRLTPGHREEAGFCGV